MAPRKKNCSVPGCEERIPYRHFFCGRCFGILPAALRGEIMDAYNIGAGKKLMDALQQAREIIPQRKEKSMVSGKSDLVEVTTLESRGISPSGKAQAFFQGDFYLTEDGEERECYIWLPISQIEVEEQKDGTCIVTLPEWLGIEKGLL